MGFHFNQGDRPLPGYTIQRGVGRGGFGEVYYATSDGGKEVALKYLRENPQIELRGAMHCLNLKSPHLVALHDIKENAEGDFFVIMEYVSGPSLRDLMNAEPSGLGVQKAAFFLRELGKGLAYLHDRGIVHRDLKPGNIFYEDGYVKIGDYGLAKIMAASQHSGQTVSVGTVHYMAPEVGSGNYDRTIDIYSLGVILYEMLLGRVPFTGQTMGEVLMKHLTAQPEVDQLPEPFPRVIRKALAKDPRERYQTVNEMVAEVMAVEDLDRSVAAFEPASLTTIAARAAEHGRVAAAAAVPVGAHGGGPLGTGSSNVGSNVPPPVVQPPLASPAAGRFDRLHERMAVRLDRIADRIDSTQVNRQLNAAVEKRTHWAERLTVSLLISAGISLGVGLGRHGDLEYAIFLFACIAAMVAGALAGCRLAIDRWQTQGKWFPRVLIAALSCIPLASVAALVDYIIHHTSRTLPIDGSWVVVLTLCALICDWPDRYREGRGGCIHLGTAFSAGLFTFVAGILIGHGEEALSLAAVSAAASLTLQSLAGMWPLAAGKEDRPNVRPAGAVNHGQAAPLPFGDACCVGSVPPVIVVDARRANATAQAGMIGTPPGAAQAVENLARLSASQLPFRSPVARTSWLMLSALLLCGSVILFAATGLVDGISQDDKSACIVSGVITSIWFLFAFSRVFSRRKSGVWRGLLRPAIFFTGLATSAGAGTALGMLDFGTPKDQAQLGTIAANDQMYHDQMRLVMLALILVGAIISLFVWLVPVAPYVPVTAQASAIEPTSRVARGRRLMWAGGLLLFLMTVITPILATLPGREADQVIPAVVGPMATTGIALLIVGLVMSRRPKPPPVKLSLPLRTAFEIDANPNLSRLLERHFTMHGYTLSTRSDLLWSFVRGSWAYQFWQKDIHHWGTKLNVAAYELDTGGYRITCYLDVDATFNRPSQPMIATLQEELNEFQVLLAGRDLKPKTEEARA